MQIPDPGRARSLSWPPVRHGVDHASKLAVQSAALRIRQRTMQRSVRWAGFACPSEHLGGGQYEAEDRFQPESVLTVAINGYFSFRLI